jgi:hypothetical protein
LNSITIGENFYIDKKNKFIVTYSSEDRKLIYYDFEGDAIYENDLIGFPSELKFYVTQNSSLFFDLRKFHIYKCNSEEDIFMCALDWNSKNYYQRSQEKDAFV